MLKILVMLFFNVVIARAGNSSLSFAIDDSGSMGGEIEQVRRGARGIMDIVLNYKSSQIKDIVIVTFNDPVYLNKVKINGTRDPDKVQAALDSIHPSNFRNNDWEEYSLSGIELALQESQPNSYLFVFTDASAKDYDKVDLIKSMCQRAQTQILFVLTDYCDDNYDRMCLVYHEIALACSGQVFIVDKYDIEKVIEYIKETVKGDKSILKTVEIPAYKETVVQFEIDDKTEYVLISAAGENVRITNTHGPSNNYKVILSTTNTEAWRLDRPPTGTYQITVHGTSQVILHVFSRTDFVFEHGFSKLVPKSTSDTSKQPIAGSKSYLSISVTDPDHEVQIQSAKILDTEGRLLNNLTLKKISPDFYITEQFISPDKLFQISVTGKVIKTNYPIERYAKTPIEPQKPEIIPIKEMSPVTSIIEGSQAQVSYKGTLRLSCAVSAYPEPKIIWKDDHGNVLISRSSPVELPYKYISYITLDNVKISGAVYYCYAINELSSHQSSTKVRVLSPFTINVAPPGTSYARYTGEAVISCKIVSTSRMRIDWSRKVESDVVPIHTSDKYTISSDGTELKINPVSLDSAGQYTCRSVLIDDPSQHREYTTNVVVNIDEKAPVTSITEGPHVHIPYDVTLRLTCTVSAYPAPNIIWKDEDGKILPSKSSPVEVPYRYKSYLTINNVRPFGTRYYCIASNTLSSHQSPVQVTVLSPFNVGLVPLIESTALYGYESVIKCKISSPYRMRIDWFRKKNRDVVPIHTSDKYTISSDGTDLKINNVSFDSAGQYTCQAVLTDDPSQHKAYTTDVVVTIDEKAPVTSITEGPYVQVPYDGTLRLTCTVSAYPAPNIIWKDDNGTVLPSKSSPVEVPYKYNSYLTINNVRPSGTRYYCIASNKLTSHQSPVQVTVLSPYTVGVVPQADSTARYGSEAVIKCKISSPSRLRIDWSREVNKEVVPIHTSAKYTISSDGTELKINNVSLDSAGQYTCQAVLIDDPSQHKAYTTDVVVTIDEKAPVTSITEGPYVQVPYDGTLRLTCTVSAYPAPNIIWKDDNGTVLPSKSSPVEVPYKYNSYLTINNVRPSGTRYYCIASNKLTSHQSPVQVTVLSPYTVGVVPQADSTARYGSEAVIKCKISSPSRLRIDWSREVNKEVVPIHTSAKYTISSDGTELKINNVSLDSAGQYTCQAVLIDDPSQHKAYTTDVVVTIDEKAPVTSITEGPYVQVPYDGTLRLTCTVSAYPAPNIIWKDDNGTVLPSKSSPAELPYKYNSYLIFNNVRPSGTRYYCIASNKLSSHQSAVQVTVLSPFTNVIAPPANTTALYDSEAVIQCKITSSASIHIKWFRKVNKNVLQINTSDKTYTISDDETELKIKPVTLDTTGQYMCQAVLIHDKEQHMELTTDVIITDLAVPVIHKNTSIVTTRRNMTVFIPCKILSGNPKPSFTWRFKGRELDEFKSLPDVGDTIKISSAALSDAGIYQCIAINVIGGDAHQTELNVEAPPTILLEKNVNTYTAIEGDTVLRIPCNAVGYPKPDIIWSKDNKTIVTDEKIEFDNTTLVLKNPVSYDSGDYKCEAANKFGKTNQTFEADVTPYLDFDNNLGDVHNIYLLEHESKDIKCILPNTTTENVRWYLNGLYENVTSSFYPIKDATQSNDGNYTCRVNTQLGSVSDTYEVDVGYLPRFIKHDVSKQFEWNGDDGYVLDCSVLAKPFADIEWLHNGKIIKDATTSQLDLAKWGNYKCAVSNPHGTITRSFEVTVSGCLIDTNYFKMNNTPLILSEEFNWPEFATAKGAYLVEPGYKLRLSCHNEDKRNHFKRFPGRTDIEATCDQQDSYLVDGTSYNFLDFICEEEVSSITVKTGTACYNEHSALIKVGFNLEHFVEAYKVCYDEEKNVPIYAHVEMSRMNSVSSAPKPSWFKYPGIGASSEKSYSCGESSLCCYGKSQLVSARDVRYGPAQRSTFIDHLNSIALWNPCDSKNTTWQTLENIARSKYEDEAKFSVWSGASGYVTKDEANIPRYLWKVFKFDGEPLAVVYINDQSPQSSDFLCDNICADNDALPLGLSTDAYTYCCEMEEFTRAFGINQDVFDESS